MVPNERFVELLTDIEPSYTTKNNASSAHDGLRAHLQSHPDFRERWRRDFLAGSYKRDTAIRPRRSGDEQERPDVDIIVVTSFTTQHAPNSVLSEVADALEDSYEVERINKRSVRVSAWNAEMDVVPVIEDGDAFLIPCREDELWKPTNPPAHTAWSTSQNKTFDGRFKKLVKMLKAWRRENPSGRRPKGFVLEVLVANHAPQSELHLGEAFAVTLEAIYAAHAPRAALGLKPFIADPALPHSDILAKVTVPQWREFIEKVRIYAAYARRAQSEADMEEATRLWRKVFGERFRRTEAPAKAASASTFAAAVAPAGGYTFPGVNATPTKPRGFA